jgi:hypothetical protein
MEIAAEAMFKLLGILLSSYVAYGFANGRIYGKYRAGGRMFFRDADPWLYWSTLVVYSLLAFALIFGSLTPSRI